MRWICLWTLAIGLAGSPASRADFNEDPYARLYDAYRKGFNSTASDRYYERVLRPPLNLLEQSKSPTQQPNYPYWFEIDPDFHGPGSAQWYERMNWRSRWNPRPTPPSNVFPYRP